MTMEISHVAASSTGSIAGLVYDAAITGSVVSLDRLLKQYGKAALSRFSLTPFSETPLHLAALLGHLEFSKQLLELKPELASEQDSEKCTPLHLAAANGHDQVVRELLKAYENACLVEDQEGRVPLHLAAMRGRVSVVKELLNSKQAQEYSLKKKAGDGDSVLHLCVKYNHVDVLKVLLAAVDDEEEVLKMTDSLGNTVLHLAVMQKQTEAVRFLLDLPRVKAEIISAKNKMELTAFDVLNYIPRDYKILEIREILALTTGAQIFRPSCSTLAANQRRDVDGAIEVPTEVQEQVQESRTWTTWLWHLVNMLMDYRGDWMNETKGSLMMVATIIATVTFTAGIAPPGGVWQQDTRESAVQVDCNEPTCYACDNETVCLAGNAVLAYYYPDHYAVFMKYNMISFISSLVVLFLLISGFPLNNKFSLWLLSLFMCMTISFLGLTFLESLWLTVPGDLLDKYDKLKLVSISLWAAMICVVGLSLLVRLSSWLRHMFRSTIFKASWRRLLVCYNYMLKALSFTPCAHWKARHVNTSNL